MGDATNRRGRCPGRGDVLVPVIQNEVGRDQPDAAGQGDVEVGGAVAVEVAGDGGDAPTTENRSCPATPV